MQKGEGRAPWLRWKGVLAGTGSIIRRTAACVVAMACITCILTQWGFVGVQFADGGAAYLLFMFIPIVVASVLLGTLPGAGTGLFAGLVLSLHARYMPLDYYELTYVTPVATILMTGIAGLVLGSLLSIAIKKTTGRRRVLLVALSCLAASIVFSIGFAFDAIAVSFAQRLAEAGLSLGIEQLAIVRDEAMAAALKAGDIGFQAIGDAVIMTITTLVCLLVTDRVMRKAGEVGLRGVFGTRLLVAVLIAFMIVVTSAYGVVTAGELADGHEDIQSEVDYLLDQMEHEKQANASALEYLWTQDDGASDSDSTDEQPRQPVLKNPFSHLLEGYAEDVDGLFILAIDNKVIAADTDRLRIVDNTTLQDLFEEETLAAVQRSAENGTLERAVYLAPSDYSDLVDLELPGTREAFASLLTRQVGYLMAGEHNGYRVVAIRPASMVFAGRSVVVNWLALSTLALLAATFVLVWKLLDSTVARRVDATNETLRRITEGDLDARVIPEGAQEFWDLAAGINITVDALQGWIAEAEKRMDAELATAKEIQESALPSVFPPYPDIQRFDIYANMNAAKEVGGDFYDFFLLGDDCGPDAGKLAFVLADVSGKGVPAALFMMRAKTQIRDYLESGMELGEAIENVNRKLCDGNDAGMFATAWVGVLDYATGHVDFVNAGHNPPLLWQNGAWHWMREKSGLPLGLFEGLPYRTFSVECGIGDQLLIYTDGVTEAFSVDEEQYGVERLENLVNQSFDLHPRELVDFVRASVAAHAEGAEQSDDITILALEIGVPPEEKIQLVVPAHADALEQVNDFVHAELDRRLCPVRTQGQLDMAIEELFVNVCRHAYAGADASVERMVRVTHAYSVNPSSLTVEIIDEGAPFDPVAALREDAATRRGIQLACESVDELRYERMGDFNVVTLVKRW